VWPTERESIAVWADELQARGEPLGELVALSLRADEVRRQGHAAEADELEHAAERLRLDHAEALLGPAIGELPLLRLRWRFGLVRGLSLDRSWPLANPNPRVILEVVAKLLARPALRHLEHIHLEAVDVDREFEAELLRELGSPRCLASPRRVVLGRMPGHFRNITPCPRHHGVVPRRMDAPARELLDGAAARGLTWLVRWGLVQALPWATGDHGSRLQQLERLLARPWAPEHERVLGRALWDSSLRVRRRVLEILPELPDDAAALLLPAVAVSHHSTLAYAGVVQGCLERLSARLPWLMALADEFESHEAWVAWWLATVTRDGPAQLAGERAQARVGAMLERRRLQRARADRRDHGLRLALVALEQLRSGGALGRPGGRPGGRLGAAALDDETVAELLEKIGRRRTTP
jgi:hypothetical protein